MHWPSPLIHGCAPSLAQDRRSSHLNFLSGHHPQLVGHERKLPYDKLSRLRTMLEQLRHAKNIQALRSFQSLVGYLVHASKVLLLGKAFLNQLFTIQSILQPGQICQLNLDARADLASWYAQCSLWSGSSVSQFLLLQQPAHHIYTDASGSWGCSALAFPHWFQLQWQRSLPAMSIAFKELLPIVVAAAVWCHTWSGSYILCHSDNVVDVKQVYTLHGRDPATAHLLQCLAFFHAQTDRRIRAIHIPGHLNCNVDDLSMNRAEVVCRCLLAYLLLPPRSLRSFWTSCFRDPQHGPPQTGGSSGALFGNSPSLIFSETLQNRVEEVPDFMSGFHSSPTAITQENVTLFVAFLGVEGRAISTIELYIAALRYMRLWLEPTNPCPFYSPYMKILLCGIKRAHSMNNPTATVRLPITASLI